jgi:hypothetical protein
MENSSARINIDHLVQLGFKTGHMSKKWRCLFNKKPIGHCLGCGNKVRITNPISKNLKLNFFKKKYIPEVHWILDFKLNFNDIEAINKCKEYIISLSNKEKVNHIYPCCYKCWNLSVFTFADYFTESIDNYYKELSINNPSYINWNTIEYTDIQGNEEYIKQKKIFDYEYISEWCNNVGICCYTEDGFNYCGKKIGKCVHTTTPTTASTTPIINPITNPIINPTTNPITVIDMDI